MPDMKWFRIPDGLRLRRRSPNAPYAQVPRKRRPSLDALRDREWRRPAWLSLPALAWLRKPDLEVPARLLVPGIAVILLLFGGGLYFGNVLGSDPSQASLITTVVKSGKVTVETVRGKRVKVTLPAKTITRKKKVKGHGTTLTQTSTQTLFNTHTQILSVPTTIVRTSTVTKTIPTTVTVTVTTTAPSS